jgi:hypothetical protein
VMNDFIPSSTTEIPPEKANDPLYTNLYNAQQTAKSRIVFTSPVYVASQNGMQSLLDGSMSPEDFVKSLVEAGKKQ